VRIEGRVDGDHYVIAHAGVMKRITLVEARQDQKLLAAIKRNGWEAIPES
jgi:hypothetical protein